MENGGEELPLKAAHAATIDRALHRRWDVTEQVGDGATSEAECPAVVAAAEDAMVEHWRRIAEDDLALTPAVVNVSPSALYFKDVRLLRYSQFADKEQESLTELHGGLRRGARVG